MSPIDIVPMEENAYVVDLEPNMDIVPNHRIYHSERTDTTIFSNVSTIPLVQQHLPSKQAPNQATKHSHVNTYASKKYHSLIIIIIFYCIGHLHRHTC